MPQRPKAWYSAHFSLRPDGLAVPLEVILGPLGAVAVLLWWNYELKRQNADLTKRLNAFVDEFIAALRKAK